MMRDSRLDFSAKKWGKQIWLVVTLILTDSGLVLFSDSDSISQKIWFQSSRALAQDSVADSNSSLIRDGVVDAGLVDLSYQSDLINMVQTISGHANSNRDRELDDAPLIEPEQFEVLLAQEVESSAQSENTVNFSNTTSSEGENDSLPSEDSVTLNFENADINALINLVSRITGKNFIVDPRVKGKVTLVSGAGLPHDQIYDIFLSVLEVSNFAAVPSGNVIKILPRNLVKQHPTPTSSNGTPDTNDEQLTHIVSLEHASVTELLPILRPLLPPTAHIAPHAGSNTLILTGTAANITRTLNLIHRMDKEQQGVDIRVIYLKHADAQKLSQIVSQTVNNYATATTKQGQIPMTIGVQVDEGLNALIIQAPRQQFPVVQALVDQLDIERPETGDVHVHYLKFAQATELVSILDGLKPAAREEETGAAPVTEISIQADEQSNALIIRADVKDFENLKAVIEKLDVRRSQVFVETIIAEVSINKESELGVDWQSNYRTSDGSDLSAGSGLTGADSGFQLGLVNRFFTNLAGTVVPNLSVVLRALRSDSNTNIISTPNLLTLDNESAEIVVGQEVPFITGSFTSNSSTSASTTTNADGTTSTNQGVVNPFQTIERKDVGLTLKVTPQINDGDTIRLEIEQEISSVSPTTVQGAADLITNTRSISATVQVDDEQIIVLGGLIRDDSADTNEWVPVLGKIPLLGALFRKKGKTAVKRNLMVFLRPKIIRLPSDLSELTRERYEFIRTEEIESLPDTRKLLKEPPPRLNKQSWINKDDVGR